MHICKFHTQCDDSDYICTHCRLICATLTCSVNTILLQMPLQHVKGHKESERLLRLRRALERQMWVWWKGAHVHAMHAAARLATYFIKLPYTQQHRHCCQCNFTPLIAATQRKSRSFAREWAKGNHANIQHSVNVFFSEFFKCFLVARVPLAISTRAYTNTLTHSSTQSERTHRCVHILARLICTLLLTTSPRCDFVPFHSLLPQYQMSTAQSHTLAATIKIPPNCHFHRHSNNCCNEVKGEAEGIS